MIPRFALSVGTKVDRLVVVLVLAVVVVDDPQDLDEAEGGSPAAAGPPPGRDRPRPWAGRLPPGLVAAGPPGAGGANHRRLGVNIAEPVRKLLLGHHPRARLAEAGLGLVVEASGVWADLPEGSASAASGHQPETAP
jgi:hypothetical protein